MSILNTAKCAACKYKFEYRASAEKYGYYDRGTMYCSYACMRYGQTKAITPQFLRNCERVNKQKEEVIQPVAHQAKKGSKQDIINRLGRMKVLLATGMHWIDAARACGWQVSENNPATAKLHIRNMFIKFCDGEYPEQLAKNPPNTQNLKNVNKQKEEPIMEEIIEKATETATEAVEVKEEEKAVEAPVMPVDHNYQRFIGYVPEGLNIKQFEMGVGGCRWNFYDNGTVGLFDDCGDPVVVFNKDQMLQLSNIAHFLWGLM